MNVKGTAVSTTAEFIRDAHGQQGYQKWLAALPQESRELLSGNVLPTAWYPVETAFATPTKIMCDLFYAGSRKGAWELGRYSAEKSLKGVYKMFVCIGSPAWLMKMGKNALSTYYSTITGEVEKLDDGAQLRVMGLDDPSGMVECRIAGWCERALTISGCKGLQVNIDKSPRKGDEALVIVGSWR